MVFIDYFASLHPGRFVGLVESLQFFQPPALFPTFGCLRFGCGGQLRGQFVEGGLATGVGL